MSDRNRQLRRLLMGVIVGLGCFILGGFWFLTQASQVFVFADGEVAAVRGSFVSAESALEAANVTLNEGDIIANGNELTSDGAPSALKVLRAKTVQVTIDGETTVYSTHQPTVGAFVTEANIVLNRADQVLADGRAIYLSDWSVAEVPTTLDIQRIKTVAIVDDGVTMQRQTLSKTVGELLQEEGIEIYAADGVTPSLGEWISADTTITIKRSTPLTILVDGRNIETRSHHTNSLAVLGEVGIGLAGRDYVRPHPDEPLTPGATIEVVRVTEEFVDEEAAIPYESLWQGTDALEIDQISTLVAGKQGVLQKRIRVVYENGVEVDRVSEGEWVAEEPINEVIGYGTNIVVRTLDSEDGPIEYWRHVRMRVTSYTAASSGKPPDHPAYGITYTGVPAGKGVVAVDPRVVPLRTEVYVPGYGVGFVGDTGGGVKGRWIDLGWDDHNYESWWGYTDVYYMTPIPDRDDINFLIPRVLP